jgi:ATP-dependent DNA helicase RecG
MESTPANPPAFLRLQRVIELEQKQSFRNRAVIGGLQKMADRWADDARKEDGDPRVVAQATRLMRTYGEATPELRPDLAARLVRILNGELEAEPEPVALPPAVPAAEAPEIPAGDERMAAETAAPAAPPVERKELQPPPKLQSTKPPKPQPKPEPAPKPEAKANGGATGEGAPPPRPDDGRMGIGMVITAEPEDLVYAPAEPTFVAQARLRRQQANVKRNPRDLTSPVTILPGVGEATAELLGRLGIVTVTDLLWHLPQRHDDFSTLRTIDKLQQGETVTVIANLWDVREKNIGFNRIMIHAILGDSTGTLHASWFNRFVKKQLTVGATMRFSGKIGLFKGQRTLENPFFEELEDERVATGRISPVYPLTEGLSNNRLRNIIHDAVDGYARFLVDPLPAQLRADYRLLELGPALQQMHFPDSQAQLDAARYRLAFEEIFYIQLGVMQRRSQLRQLPARPFVLAEEDLATFTAALPFPLTGAQQRVIGEIVADLAGATPMTRLLQGDVGSGKTAVAAAAMWTALLGGAQSALLAPTQVLAEQHHRGLSRLLGDLSRPDGPPIRVALLTGRVTGAARAALLAGLSDGAIDVVVGTTALIQEGVEFADLGLIVVDEQHRFGVEQRGALRTRAGGQPHLLAMSATPIPRSLALTLYGDLDISTVDEMPPGRTPIKTTLLKPAERERIYGFIRREAGAGRQAFIIYPLVEESEKIEAGAAVQEFERLQSNVFPELKLGLLHGRMSGAEKDEIMRSFAANDLQVLVSTTVVEVGIDVPNATVIVIEEADRFGLAQLHQLRGRVGRGQQASFCVLVSGAEAKSAIDRLAFLEKNTDGFALAEKDLALRGPGEFLGTRQSGLPDLRVAQLSDISLIATAREAAQRFFALDPALALYPQLAGQIERFWRGHGDVS